MVVYYMTFAMIACAFVLIGYNFVNLRNHAEGADEMVRMAANIRSGAKTFLRREDRVITWVVVIMGIGFTLTQEALAGVSLAIGSLLVRCAVEVGMRGGTYGNVRTTNAARVTGALSRTLRIATLGGSLSGFSVPAFGLLGFTVIFLLSWKNGPNTIGHSLLFDTPCNVMATRLTAYSLGCSIVAMFNRVAGGTYTKSADIAGDLSGKGKHNLEEDDPRNVCSIADLIGDCVNDLAGNISDLCESFVATPMACIVIAIQNYSSDAKTLLLACSFPFILITGGIFSTLLSIMFVILKNRRRYKWIPLEEASKAARDGTATREIEKALKENVTRIGKEGTELRMEYSLEIDDPGAELNTATTISAVITLAVGLLGAKLLFDGNQIVETFAKGWWWAPWLAALFGVLSSVVVGLLTERYTSTKYRYVKGIAKMAPQGGAFVVSEGIAVGNHSAFWPSIIIAASIIIAYLLCGFYGIAIAAVGMLSFVGTTVSIDAFGPIADNAGGIAEGCHLPEEVRRITDELDALGNTTAAVGKGNAIGAAAFSTITMFMAFIGNIPVFNLNEPDSIVRMVAGGIIGMAVIKEFVSILTKNTLRAAHKLAAVAEDQFERPGVMEGTVPPNYNEAIGIASDNALRYMLVPSLLAVVSPLIVGFTVGPMAVLGLLLGSTYQAIGEAFFNGNAGGAYDNAKKYIEMGLLEGFGKHTDAHLAAIMGDTIGDIMKDVVAVCCDICIKIMVTVSTAMAVMFYMYHIF